MGWWTSERGFSGMMVEWDNLLSGMMIEWDGG